MISQANITPHTPMGANLVPGGGATFRAWAPRASAVYVNGTFGGIPRKGRTDDLLMVKDSNGYWTGFLPDAKDGDPYLFFVVGAGSSDPKRDPYAREMATDDKFPNCSCLIRASTFPWHDSAFVTPDFSNMIVYQLHVGTYAPRSTGATSTFLDVIEKIEYLVALGINVLQPLPVDELESDPSLGYNGADLFSPDLPYQASGPVLSHYLTTINRLLNQKGFPPMTVSDIATGPGQLKTLVDLCHVYGIAVVLDVVYNHAGGFDGDDRSLYFWDRAVNNGDNNQSLYCTDQDRGTGGLSFALWNNDVRQFLINNAKYYLEEFHVDGFRYDEISGLLSMNKDSGFSFCRDLTDTLRSVKPRLIQNAEYWPSEFNDYPRPGPLIVTPSQQGGTGFDVVQHDGLRSAVRGAVQQAFFGQNAVVDFDSIAGNLYPQGYAHGWQAVPCVENHDIVKIGQEKRIAALADGSDPRSWYARSRSRFATSLLLTAPGIPQIFMGQEFLEGQQWHWDPKDLAHLIGFSRLHSGDTIAGDHLHFTQDLIRLRWSQPALRGDNVRAFYVHNQNRVIAFHRWIEGSGNDVIVVATLAESTWFHYSIGFPFAGGWAEVFNSDAYDNFVNPIVAGNGGGVTASGGPLHGFQASAGLVIPANGVVVFARL